MSRKAARTPLAEPPSTADGAFGHGPVDDSQQASLESRPDFEDDRGILSDLRLALFYTWSDIKNRPRNTCIGFGATLTVVLVTGLILLSIGKSRVVFLRFAELSVGEMDSLILAEGSVPFVNYTELEPKFARSARTEGSAPRWLVKGEFSKFSYGNLSQIPNATTNVLAIDSKREQEIGIGRAYKYRQIGFAEVQGLKSVFRYAEVTPNIGDRAKLFIDIAGVLSQQNVQLGGQTNVAPANTTNVTTNQQAAEEFAANNPFLFIPGIGNISTETLFGTNFSGVSNLTTAINNVIAINNAVSSLSITDFLEPELKLVAADAFPSALGKYPGTLGNMVIIDYRYLVDALIEQLCYENIRNPFAIVGGAAPASPLPPADVLRQQLYMPDYVLVVVAMLKDRFTTYYKSTKPRDADMIQWSNDLFYALGVDFGGNVEYPIALAMVGFDNFALFLNSIFTVAVAVIITLGALLVYTLLLTNSEERGFEVAMLRAQGMRKRQLFILMTTQMTAFVLPGLLLAVALILSFNAIAEVALTLYTYAPAVTDRIDALSLALPIAVGICVPIAGNIGPIRAALSQSLRDALDVYRNKMNETTVVATKLAELGMEPFTVMMAWLLVFVGFMVYYLVPLAFIFNELWLFFLVMNIILILMLFGMCLMGGTLQVFLERGFLWLLLWGKETRLKTLIVKNFHSHSERNSKGFMMFTLSVACIVFGGVLFTLLSSSIIETVSVLTGADVTVTSLQFDTPINKTELDAFFKRHPNYVAAWSYETFPLTAYPQMASVAYIRNSIGFPTSPQQFVGLQKNFLDAAFGRYVLIDDLENLPYTTSQTGAVDIVASLYTHPALRSVRPAGPIYSGFPPNETRPAVEVKYSLIMPSISSSAATDVIGLTAGSFDTIAFEYDIGQSVGKRTVTTVYLASARALCRKFPGFLGISPIPFSFSRAPTFVNVDDFAVLVRSNAIDFPSRQNDPEFQYSDEDSTTAVVYRKLYVRLQPSVEGENREYFVNLLQSQVNPYYHLTADTKSITDSVRVAGDMIMYGFYFIATIAIILDTLMLWLVFVSNVQLNSWSFAVLRSLGFTVWQLRRSYVYESMSLVLAGFTVGTVIGVLVAITLVLQVNLFLQLPFTFAFPTGLFCFLLGMSIVSAVIAPIIPANAIARRPIASVLKGG